MICQKLDRTGVEQRGAVKELSLQALPNFQQTQIQVELDKPAASRDRAHLYARQAQTFVRGVLEGKHDLKQRMATEVSFRLQVLHQLLKGQVLMVIRLQRRLPYSRAVRGKADRPRGPLRITKVLTKKPMSPSSSRRVRLAIGEPTAISGWPL